MSDWMEGLVLLLCVLILRVIPVYFNIFYIVCASLTDLQQLPYNCFMAIPQVCVLSMYTYVYDCIDCSVTKSGI